ncbi:MAG: type 1 glutamine amidotransferase [Solirubrobacteraceae bacterium]
MPTVQLVDVLHERGLNPVLRRVSETPRLPDPSSLSIVILLGADRFGSGRAGLDAELDWLRETDRAGTPILGIGHGARALVSALGGAVGPAERGQRGWALVDTAVPHLVPAGPWLAWQHDVILLPPKAELLAHNRLGPQAFTIGPHLGVQFHPEATPRSAAAWVKRDRSSVDFHDTLTGTTRDPAAARVCARRLFSAFIDTIELG